MPKDQAYLEAEKKIAKALKSGATELDLSYIVVERPYGFEGNEDIVKIRLTELPISIGSLTKLKSLNLSSNQLTTLPESFSQLTQLTSLDLSRNQLTALPDSLGQLTQLTSLVLFHNKLTTLPDSLGLLAQLTELDLSYNQLTALPESLGQLTQLTELNLSYNQLTNLPESLGQLTYLRGLSLSNNQLITLPESLGRLTRLRHFTIQSNLIKQLPSSIGNWALLEEFQLHGNEISNLPDEIGNLQNLRILGIGFSTFGNSINILPLSLSKLKNLTHIALANLNLKVIPDWIHELKYLSHLYLNNNSLNDVPVSLAQLERLEYLTLEKNPLNPALQSAYDQGLGAVKAYLHSLEQNAEPLYEAKLVLVGEGGVGKTTLLNALIKREERIPRKDETTTHGVKIDVDALQLPHPEKEGVKIQLNAWDFGGQEVYRVTHQFFFSRRSLYLLVWEPRRGVQQCQVEDWLNLIRLRVGDQARVLIISTYSRSGEHLARINKPDFEREYGKIIVGFYEVDSLVPDEATGEMVGIAELKKIIADESAKLEQMGMMFNRGWKDARDQLIKHPDPRISYTEFSKICTQPPHSLNRVDTDILAHLMHDLGYIVHYDDDEKLRDDVVLKPEWLTKAIGFVLEDRTTRDAEGILPDKRLPQVWRDHAFKDEPRYDPVVYPFFLRLMEKYNVSYRLPEERHASLVAQHVPQVRPTLPWLPEDIPQENLRRIAMICSMEEEPPGLVPWMIVRTHDYAVEQNNHRLHWQNGMFLRHGTHGTAVLEKRGHEFHVYAQGTYPEYFMNVLQETLQKLIKDNWPGLEGRYRFTVPCPTITDGKHCKGRFNIQALRQFIANGVQEIPCQECFKSHPIKKLLSGLEPNPVEVQLQEINEKLAGMDSRIANYFMATLRAIADEGKSGPRLFTLRGADAGFSPKQLFTRPLRLQLWCEAEGCQHPVIAEGKGKYPIDEPRKWVMKIAPYANFALSVLSTVVPMAGPAINTFFGPKTTEAWGIKEQLDLAKAIINELPPEIMETDRSALPRDVLNEPERSGILALHNLLREVDPTQAKLGLYRATTYTGDYRWLCKHHYDAWQPNIPDVI